MSTFQTGWGIKKRNLQRPRLTKFHKKIELAKKIYDSIIITYLSSATIPQRMWHSNREAYIWKVQKKASISNAFISTIRLTFPDAANIPVHSQPLLSWHEKYFIRLWVALSECTKFSDLCFCFSPNLYGACGQMVKALDPRSKGLGFDSCSAGQV